MTMKAEVVEPFRLLRAIAQRGTVAGHARRVLLRKGRQGLTELVTNTALLLHRLGRLETLPGGIR